MASGYDRPRGRHTRLWGSMMGVLVDHATGERSQPMPWGTCMKASGERLKASGATTLAEYMAMGKRWTCTPAPN
jgi:hypothetical protein